MRCIAIDDEPLALSIIAQFCSRMEGVEVATFTDPIVGIAEVKSSRPDLLFLDIEMGEVRGTELAREVPEGVMIIFTTAYAQFALDGFDIGVIDFLHKPFSFPRFEKAVERAREIHSLRSATSDDGDVVMVKIEYQSVAIKLREITHVEAMDNYIKIYTATSRPYMPQMSLKSFEELLPSEHFLRVHKSYIVARRAITHHTRTHATLSDDIYIPIGRSYIDTFQAWI